MGWVYWFIEDYMRKTRSKVINVEATKKIDHRRVNFSFSIFRFVLKPEKMKCLGTEKQCDCVATRINFVEST